MQERKYKTEVRREELLQCLYQEELTGGQSASVSQLFSKEDWSKNEPPDEGMITGVPLTLVPPLYSITYKHSTMHEWPVATNCTSGAKESDCITGKWLHIIRKVVA